MSTSIERPLSPLISALVDAAHQDARTTPSSKAGQQPQTPQYTMFKWQLQEAAEAAKGASSTKRVSSVGGGKRDTAGGGGHKRESTSGSAMSFDVEEGGEPSHNLEISCEFDANFQNADLSGQPGADVRPALPPSLGPVAFIFRWYTKRATQFPPGFPAAEDLLDSPAMLLPDQGAPKRVSTSGGSAPSSLPRSTQGSRTSSTGEAAAAAGSTWSDGLPLHGGHSLNRAPDPVMGLTELNEMLEELELVPRCVSRQDVTEAFRAAAQVKCDPPNKLPCGQVRPDEIRFPQFCDALVRLALAADARRALNAGGKPAAPQAAVVSLMATLEITSSSLSALKRKLDALARMSADRGAKRNAIKWMYVGPQSAMDAARSSLPPLAGGWGVDSPTRAPQELHNVLMGCDQAAESRYLPNWRQFPEPALNLGSILPGELRCLRILLRNRSPYTMYLRVDTSGAEGFLACAFKELPLPSGVPRVLDVQAHFEAPGEYTGHILVYSRIKQEGVQCVNPIPFYALVLGSDPDARFPRNRGERSALASKGVGLDPPKSEALSAALSTTGSQRHSWAGSLPRGGASARGAPSSEQRLSRRDSSTSGAEQSLDTRGGAGGGHWSAPAPLTSHASAPGAAAAAAGLGAPPAKPPLPPRLPLHQ